MTTVQPGGSESWPFQDAPNTAVITVRQVMDDGSPILLVTHDKDDGCWQFLAGGEPAMDDALVVGLRSVIALDASLVDLADLPLGWRAWREGPGRPWHREKKEG